MPFGRFIHHADQAASVTTAHACCRAYPCGRLPCALAPSPFTYLVSRPGRCCFTPPGSPLTGVLSQCKTTLALLMVQVYGVCHLLRQLSSGDLLTIGLPPAAPLLSALAYHVSPCSNLLYSIFYVFF